MTEFDARAHALMERQVGYILEGLDDAAVRELARLAVMLHLTHDGISPAGRTTLQDVLRAIGPDFLLTFRALREASRQAIRHRRNWRTRT
jgi:hypothetical protein